jgi:hypothetical protein
MPMSPCRIASLALVAVAAACLGLGGCVWYLNPLCTDQVKNGNETDVDCGGGTCRQCGLDSSCRAASDCESGNCAGGRCAAPPCANGVQDGAETDVDCGGGTCSRCSGGRACRANSDCFNEKCDPGTSRCAALAPVSFAGAVSYGAGEKTYALFTGDLDRDGHPDLVAANEQGDSITVFINRGDGTFRRVAPDFATGAYPTGGAIADMNGDGIPDVLTANYHGNSVSVLLGVGDGTFRETLTFPTIDGGATGNLAVGDLDGDGRLDVVATNPSRSSFSLLLGRGDGTLAPAINVPVGIIGGSEPFSAAIADLNGDAKNDVAVADLTTRTIIVRLGNGDGTFGGEVAFTEGGIPPYIVVAYDVDLDGRVDLLCANRGSDDVSVLLGRGDGTFRDPITSGTGAGTGPYSLAVADFNLDGVPDVVTANFQTGNASVLLGLGNGRFEAPLDAGRTGTTSYGAVTGDFDGDGKPDLAVCSAGSNDVAVKINTSR